MIDLVIGDQKVWKGLSKEKVATTEKVVNLFATLIGREGEH